MSLNFIRKLLQGPSPGILLSWLPAVLAGLTMLQACLESVAPDLEPPTVTLTHPAPQDTVFDEVTLTATVIDNVGIFRVDFYIDNTPYTGQQVANNVYQYRWNTTGEADLSVHQIYVKAFDNSSNVTVTPPLLCVVNNQGRPPLAVTLNPVHSTRKHSLGLSWTQSIEREFLAYRLYRNTRDVWDTTAVLVTEVREQARTSFIDLGKNADSSLVTPFGLDENTTYYYRLSVCDTAEREAHSNVVWATTSSPNAVQLKKGYQATKDQITIGWTSFDEDVKYYRIHRARYAAVGESLDDSIAVVYPPNTSYQDTGLTALTSYYYRVILVDEAGYTSRSNVIMATTTDLPPLVLYDPNVAAIGKTWIRLTWSRSRETDAVTYRIYRAKHPLVTEVDNLVATITNRGDTVLIDQDLEPAVKYYYVVYHYDSRGNYKPSNEISVTTLAMSPLPLAITSLGKYDLTLRWAQYADNDFAAYKLYRGSYPNFDTSSASLKRIITNRSTVTFNDHNLARETVYYYQLFVCDDSGGEAHSQLSLITRDIEAVVIKEIQNVAAQQKRITFTRNRLDTDFERYEIYRDTTIDVDRNDILVGTVTTRTDTVFDDNYQFLTGKNYFYRIYVRDKQGNFSAGSNILNTGDKTAPRASALGFQQGDYYFITLSWLANNESDFHKYALYRSGDNFKKDSLLVVSLYNRNSTIFTDGNLTPGKNYYYQLRSYDVGGNYSKSGTISVTTKP